MFNRFAAVKLLFHGCDCFLQRKPAAVQNAESLFQLAAFCLRNTGTCQANAVQTEYISRLPGYNHKRRHVLIYMCLPANHGTAADFAELMHGSKTADNGTVLNRYMPCQSCHIRHNNIVAYNAVMCNVGISHH